MTGHPGGPPRAGKYEEKQNKKQEWPRPFERRGDKKYPIFFRDKARNKASIRIGSFNFIAFDIRFWFLRGKSGSVRRQDGDQKRMSSDVATEFAIFI
jgi:hypothetical protein